MNLHIDPQALNDAITATSQALGIRDLYVEKDYWVTLALLRLANSDLSEEIVFKGGTSLSKAHKIIERFSEDLDLALIPEKGRSNNQTKQKLRSITNTAGQDLTEDTENSRKYSKSRKIYFEYDKQIDNTNWGQISPNLLVEANAFATPFPMSKVQISSYIYEYLHGTDNAALIEEFELEPFDFNVLHVERTLAEKIMALVKASTREDHIGSLGEKIRHIYDLHRLITVGEMAEFISGDEFKPMIEAVKEDDGASPVGDQSWLDNPCYQCSLFSTPDEIFPELRPIYEGDFSGMLFGELPPMEDVQVSLELIGARLEECDC
ncbi:hypothetical protein GO013_00015 [Pseudodesulfovibrio sp. JC047]|uniref:nucleotidyl transferase AbiEii/AbiGii toxin family protein n=1 Tax=Pseudodesulfovibrio sp. JC047 TaxID=2683199 RepID=UPI0013D03254|nr:nucleotidyl transferase AbiEii/AbiGii toxin family protein [Pseudodesulfovibrio sp. JC047]NDV17802.1 hypothetical protein [Pseudodesulfovibrio sp. JC047]